MRECLILGFHHLQNAQHGNCKCHQEQDLWRTHQLNRLFYFDLANITGTQGYVFIEHFGVDDAAKANTKSDAAPPAKKPAMAPRVANSPSRAR